MVNKHIYSTDRADSKYLLKEKSKLENPEVLILHQGDDEKFVLTWYGKSDYECTSAGEAKRLRYKTKKGFLKFETRSEYDDSGENTPLHNYDYAVIFETKGMFNVTKDQAEVLMKEPYTDNFGKTLYEIIKSENLASILLEPKAQRQREEFLKKDYGLAFSTLEQHNKTLNKAREEEKQKEIDKRKQERDLKAAENTPKFLSLLSRFKSKGK